MDGGKGEAAKSCTEVITVLLLLSRFSRVRLCATPQTAAHQAPPTICHMFTEQKLNNFKKQSWGLKKYDVLRVTTKTEQPDWKSQEQKVRDAKAQAKARWQKGS